MAMPSSLRGWSVVAALFVVLMTSSGLGFYNLSVFLSVLTRSDRFSVEAVALGNSLFFVVNGFAGLGVSLLLERWGARVVVSVGGVVSALALLALGRVASLPELYAVYALFALGFAATALIPAMTVVAHWFVRRRSVAMSVVSTGLSMGGIVVTPVCARFLESDGLAAVSPFLAAAYLVGTLPLTWLLVRDRPPATEWNGEVDQAGKSHLSAATPAEGVPYQSALVSHFFIWFGAAYVLIMLAQVGAMVHVYKMVSLRFDPEFARRLFPVLAASSVIGRFCGGFVLMKVPARPIAASLILVQALALTGFGLLQQRVAMIGAVVAFGLSVGNLLMIQPLMLADAFGVRDYGRIYSASQLVSTIGYALGPGLLGIAFATFGGYAEAFTLGAVSSILGLFCLIWAGTPEAAKGQAH